MSKAKIDHVEGSSLTLTSEGYEAQRSARVSGLAGSAPDRLHAALKAHGMPRIGDPHPSIPDLRVVKVAVEPDSPTDATVKITYRSPQGSHAGRSTVEIGASVANTTVMEDMAGNRITVAYSPTGKAEDLRTQTTRVSRLAPQTTLQITRVELTSPLDKARRFIGGVNQTAVFDGPAGTWLCVAITGNSADGGNSYSVTYKFQFDPEGWQPTVAYIDPGTRQPPTDLVKGVGSKTVHIYPELEFKELGL